MTPVSYTERNGEVVFKYKYSDMKRWLSVHRTSGDAGPLLYAMRGSMMVYLMSGTIERPCPASKMGTPIGKIHVKHNPLFDGKLKTPQEMCIPPNEELMFKDQKLVFLDMSETQNELWDKAASIISKAAGTYENQMTKDIGMWAVAELRKQFKLVRHETNPS